MSLSLFSTTSSSSMTPILRVVIFYPYCFISSTIVLFFSILNNCLILFYTHCLLSLTAVPNISVFYPLLFSTSLFSNFLYPQYICIQSSIFNPQSIFVFYSQCLCLLFSLISVPYSFLFLTSLSCIILYPQFNIT